ncbi:MAG: CDP-alcohol phosphatidyltransferase family protein, partial [Propioniciclava sp.]
MSTSPDDPAGSAPEVALRPLTLPNLITLVRFLLIGPLCWMILTGTAQGTWTPVILLGLWASTDWIDGVLARALHQVSRFGQLLDPLADRLGISAILLSLAVVDAVPWWMLVVIVAVDLVVLSIAQGPLRDGSLRVSWIGKVRTATLLFAIVLLVLGVSVWQPA